MSVRGIRGDDGARRIVGDSAPDDEEPDAPEGDEEQDPGTAAARQALDALADDDAGSFADALGVLVDLHESAPAKDAPKPALKLTLRKGDT